MKITHNLSIAYKSIAETTFKLTGSDVAYSKINDFSRLVDELVISINLMQELVSKHTRKDNRVLMLYITGCIIDELNCQAVEVFSDEEPKPLRDFINGQFAEVMSFTRSKELFLEGNRLSNLLGAYDDNYASIKNELVKVSE